MTHTIHHPDHVEAMADALSHVLGRHLGTMIDDTEADQVLTELERAGYTLTPYGDTTTHDGEAIFSHGDLTAIVHINATDNPTQARHAILNAREALNLTIPN